MTKIAVHKKENDFSSKWLEYCEKNQIDYKIVNCYSNDIVQDINDCDALMWHFHHYNPKDVLFAKQLIYSLEAAGICVFPDFNTCWHFDDKLGQKYLLESIDAPIVPTYVFFDKNKALKWVDSNDFPKVFKLRRGSGSAHVKLVSEKREAKKIIRKAFSTGYSQYNRTANLLERWRKFRIGKLGVIGLFKGVVRLGYVPEFARTVGNEIGYVYFQDFIPANEFDIRVIVIDGKACAIKRINREGDFRASGSGNFRYNKDNFSEELISMSLNLAEKVKSKCLAIDYVYDGSKPLIVELSYGFPSGPFAEDCPGYWDSNLVWHSGSFNLQGWMVDTVVKQVERKKRGN